MNIPIQLLKVQLGEKNAVIREQIIRFLHSRNSCAFRDLEVEAADGVVTLRGNTRSFYHRQLALTHSKRVVGDCLLVDEIVVRNEEDV